MRNDQQLIDGLTLAEAKEKAALLGALLGEPLAEFIQHQAPQHCPIPRHLLKIVQIFERARQEPIRLCISTPPGHAKTITVLRALTWWLKNAPADTCAYVSYSDRQGWGKSKIARDMAREAGVGLDPATTSAAEWRTTYGGGLLAGGVGGRLTGQRVTGLAVIDDPIKNRKEADSQLMRDDIWNWYTTVFRTRLEDASAVVIHTRWHSDDLIGRLEQSGEWEIVNLTGVAEPDDLLGREPGEALWPEMYSAIELGKIRKDIGEYDFASLFQGRPRPRGSRVFGDAHYYTPGDVNLEGARMFIAGDPAASEKTTADYSASVAIAAMGRGSDMVCYVKEVYRAQVEVSQFCDDMVAFQQRNGNASMGIEQAGVGRPIPKMLKRINPNLMVQGITPLGDKFQRAQPAAAAWNDGRILVPNDSPPWLLAFLKEILSFTGVGDAHDDQCLAGDTLIETAYGPVEISRIMPGDFVWTRCGLRAVLAIGNTGIKTTKTVVLSNGDSFRATGNHPLIDRQSATIMVDSVEHGSMLCGWKMKSNSWESFSVDTPTQGLSLTGGISFRTFMTGGEGSSRSTGKYGRRPMGQFRRGMRSTMKMETRSTMRSEIFAVSRGRSMHYGMPMIIESLVNLNTLPAFDRWRRSGMGQRMERNGTASMGNLHGRQGRSVTLSARNAGKSSRHRDQSLQGTAVILAASVDEENGISPRRNAESVNAFSVAAWKPRPVPVHVLAVLPGRTEPVFNLSIQGDHEYFGAGVLMHNCDALAHVFNMAHAQAPSYQRHDKPILRPRR